MGIKELGNELLRQQTLYEQSLKQSKQAADSISQALKNITPEQIQACLQVGVDITPLVSVDVERMQHDKEYRDKMCELQSQICDALESVLEKALCSE